MAPEEARKEVDLIKKFAHPDIVQILIILLKTIILYC
jgi:hypothetical protein